nr:unnamed protein product [Callosobruchus chinensis]
MGYYHTVLGWYYH